MNLWNISEIVVLRLVLYLIGNLLSSGCQGVVPDASQEGLLRPYRSYSDVTLFQYNVPPQVVRATWEFAAFMDRPNCPEREVHIYVQHGSYPVMSPDGSSFPKNMYTSRTHLYRITTKTSYDPHDAALLPLYNPLPGHWFAAAYLPNFDQPIQQKGIHHKCHYSLGSVALWSELANIPLLPSMDTTVLYSNSQFSYYKLFVPAHIWHFRVRLSECEALSSSSTDACFTSVSMRARALPMYDHDNSSSKDTYVLEEFQPYTDTYYYLLVVSPVNIKFRVDVIMTECLPSILGHSFPEQYEELTLATEVHSNTTVKHRWADAILSRNDSRSQLNNLHVNSGLELNPKNQCLPYFRLSRIKHIQDFKDTFLLQGKDWYTSWLVLTEHLPVVTSLDILPFMDVGGTLQIGIELDELLLNASNQLVLVSACIRKGRPPRLKRTQIECDSDLAFNVSTRNRHSVRNTKLIPFPEPDQWYIAFTLLCFSNGTSVPCVLRDVMMSLDLHVHPCVTDDASSCGPHGSCEETHIRQFFFTSCKCITGYRGWDCSDATYAKSESLLVWTTLLLTLSNVAFLPAVVVAARRRLISQALLYLATMLASFFYHACDEEAYGFCITRYGVLQFCDFFISILSLWVTLVSLADLPVRYMPPLYLVGVLITSVGVQMNRTGLLAFLIPAVIGCCIPIWSYGFRCWRSRSFLPLRGAGLVKLLPGFGLAGTGLALFAALETEDNYQYIHSTWHVLMGLSLVFLLPKQASRPSRESSIAEVVDVGDYNVFTPPFIIDLERKYLVSTELYR